MVYLYSERKNFRLCRHVEISSDLEINKLGLLAVMMNYFSHRHILQRFVFGEYGCAYFRIFQLI